MNINTHELEEKMRRRTGAPAVMLLVLCVLMLVPSVFAAASFQVSQIACPSGEKVGSPFSCTLTLRNSGDAPGTIGTVTLSPDESNWLEQASYPKSVNQQNVSVGDFVDVVFSGLKATKAGLRKFSEVRIDEASDTSSAVTGVSVNIIDVSVLVTQTLPNGSMYSNFTATAEVTASGDVAVTLSFAVDSGGCGIGNQDAQKTFDMSHQSRKAYTWVVTMGSGGDCKYTITASTTEKGTVALVTDSQQKSVTCTNCPTDSGGSSGGGGGAGGGGGGSVAATLGELQGSVTQVFGANERVSFVLGGKNHSVTLRNFTATTAEIEVRSHPQTATLELGQTRNFDVTHDGKDDLAVQLKGINVLTKKVTFVLTSLVAQTAAGEKAAAEKAPQQEPAGAGAAGRGAGTGAGGIGEFLPGKLHVASIIIAVVVLGFVLYYLWYRHSPERKLRELQRRVTWKAKKGLAEPHVELGKKR